jgi:hypothetical protein
MDVLYPEISAKKWQKWEIAKNLNLICVKVMRNHEHSTA